MLGPARNHEQLAGFERHCALAQFDIEYSVEHQEQFVGVIVSMPDELALDLDQPHFIVVVARNDPRRPMVGEACQLLWNIDLLGHQ